jgi:CRP-like cAMP-binding protein
MWGISLNGRAVDVVGEMGVITGMLRSATLEVESFTRLIVIAKTAFEVLLEADDHMAAKRYLRLVDVFCAAGYARVMSVVRSANPDQSVGRSYAAYLRIYHKL